MLWMGTWVHPYTLFTPAREGADFRKIGAWLSPSDVVMSWLRLQTPKHWIPQPRHMYAKCLSSLRCCGWAYGCILIAVLHVQGGGVNLRKNGVWPSLYEMLWCHVWGCKCKPPLTATHIHIGIGCIQSVWVAWDAVDGHMVGAPLDWYLWRWGVDFRKIGWLSLSDVVRSWLRLQPPRDCIP